MQFFLGGTKRIFLFNETNPSGVKRSDASYESAIKEAEKSLQIVNGIKVGKCILSHLKYFKNPMSNTCIDYLHSVLEGVMKTLFRYWFEGDCNKNYSLKKYMKEIDNRLMSIQHPSFVSTLPRSIYCWAQWRAHEFLHFFIIL